jgi:formamidopyrimidine-DNA glycosylase
MPELPDLEVLKEVLKRRVVGRPIASARALRPGLLKTVEPPLDALVGRSIAAVDRRGKHLILSLEPTLCVVVHLMVAGRFVACRSDTRPTKATGFSVTFADGDDLRLVENGAVKRAAIYVVHNPGDVPWVARAGIEPLSPEFDAARLAAMASGKRRQVKKLLTDQDTIAGIGTAYADEILFAAKISPIRFANTLDRDDLARLHVSIRNVLLEAIEEIRRSTGDALVEAEVRDFLRVYAREGEPCPVCGTRIAGIRYAETRTYYCPTCQSAGRTLPDRRSWLSR